MARETCRLECSTGGYPAAIAYSRTYTLRLAGADGFRSSGLHGGGSRLVRSFRPAPASYTDPKGPVLRKEISASSSSNTAYAASACATHVNTACKTRTSSVRLPYQALRVPMTDGLKGRGVNGDKHIRHRIFWVQLATQEARSADAGWRQLATCVF